MSKIRYLAISRAVKFFRKNSFGWSLSNDESDRVKLEDAQKTLMDLSDRLELIFPSFNRRRNGAEMTRQLIN